MYFGQDLDAMIEARNAREWEEQNAEPDVDWDVVFSGFAEAVEGLKESCQALGDAAKLMEGFPIEMRIWSIFNDLEGIQIDVDNMRKQLEREVKNA